MKSKVKKIKPMKVRFIKDYYYSTDELEIVFTFNLKKTNESSYYLTDLKNLIYRLEKK